MRHGWECASFHAVVWLLYNAHLSLEYTCLQLLWIVALSHSARFILAPPWILVAFLGEWASGDDYVGCAICTPRCWLYRVLAVRYCERSSQCPATVHTLGRSSTTYAGFQAKSICRRVDALEPVYRFLQTAQASEHSIMTVVSIGTALRWTSDSLQRHGMFERICSASNGLNSGPSAS